MSACRKRFKKVDKYINLSFFQILPTFNTKEYLKLFTYANYNLKRLICFNFLGIISFLFEVNITNDENFKFSILRILSKTIELAQMHVQLNTVLIDYLPEIETFATITTDERREAEAIKLYYLFISQVNLFNFSIAIKLKPLILKLSIDYHSSVCAHIQKLLPIICRYYKFRLKLESKVLCALLFRKKCILTFFNRSFCLNQLIRL